MPNPSPVLSIGMPVYNGARYIKEALDSLLTQTYTDFELIISDNASTDETEAICREYASRDSRIRVVRHDENRGAIANFSYVLTQARGKFFMWAAHDDKWSSDYIDILLRALLDCDALSLAYGVPILTNPDGGIEKVGKNNFFRSRMMRIHPQNPALLNLLIYYLDRNPFKIYGIFKTASLKGCALEPFYGSAQNTDNVFLLRFIATHSLRECPEAHYWYRLVPKTEKQYAERDAYEPPSHLLTEIRFARELAYILFRKGLVLGILTCPILPLLFLSAYLKPLISRTWRTIVAHG